MADIVNSIYKLRYMDEISLNKSPIHRLHPVSKILVTFIFLITVVSFGKYDIYPLIPLAVYPVFIFSLSDTPYKDIFKRALYVSPLIIGVGIFNPIFDTKLVSIGGYFYLSSGWVSFISLIIKSFLCVISALLLIATTGMDKIASGLRHLKVPRVFVLQLTLTYRYIMVLAEEASRLYTAYKLRAPGQKGVKLKIFGSLAGQLLLRTFAKAERVYIAMKLRGFEGEYNNVSISGFKIHDFIYIVAWIFFFLISRTVNIPLLLGSLVTGVLLF